MGLNGEITISKGPNKKFYLIISNSCMNFQGITLGCACKMFKKLSKFVQNLFEMTIWNLCALDYVI